MTSDVGARTVPLGQGGEGCRLQGERQDEDQETREEAGPMVQEGEKKG